MRNIIFTATVAVLLSVLLAGAAFAHAHLQAAQPPIGGTVKISPAKLDLTFSEELNLKFTGVKVIDPDNKQIQTGDALLTGGDKTLTVPLPQSLRAGTYQVQWHVLSHDGHKTHGEYMFTIAP